MSIQNRRARFDYEIASTIEAGIVLCGTEVKSLRAGRASIAEAYVTVDGGELWLINARIEPWKTASENHEPTRRRKLLVRRREIDRIESEIRRGGMTAIALNFHFSDGTQGGAKNGGRKGLVKVTVGIARGKTKGDKRQTEKDRDWKRDQARLMRDKG